MDRSGLRWEGRRLQIGVVDQIGQPCAELVLPGGRDGLERDAVRAREQEGLAPACGQEHPGLAAGQRERVGDQVDGLRGLAHQDLGGGVGDDGLPEVGAEEVGGVLGDHRHSGRRLRAALARR